ncbi:mechanosensitive ion channel family protein [Ideonella livida]|uniref:Mechanosensitive ion channel n=1 Tax=Ideonella livida TaxID=2707176 RepID=A0A7C9TIP7_9BURK|nr:mechanosensitive ion channel domain-containing protein [Ideonella livida]NDY89985.1 mechanosensitive ion channel [Ideonella livida]
MNTTSTLPQLSLDQVLAALRHPHAWIELAAVAIAVGLAWLMVRLLRGAEAPRGSIWFGDRIVDGVFFPVLALGLTYGVRALLQVLAIEVSLFRIVLPVMVSFAVIRLSVRVLSAAFPESRVVRMAERTISWVAWAAVVAWVTGVLPQLLEELDQVHWKLGTSQVSLRTLLEGSLSAGFVLMLVLWASAAIESRLLQGATGEQLSLRKAAANLVRAALTFVGLLLALSAVGIDLTALSVLGGAVGVGLGFGLQKLAANYVSGFVILAERSLRIGDIVKIDQFEGKVTDITTRYTVVRAPSGREAIVPNETLITTTVENLSLADRHLLLQSPVSVAYGTDLQALMPALVERVRAVPRVLADPAPSVLLNAFGADGLDLVVCYWIGDPENGQGNVRSDVNLAVLALLNEQGVEIPYPQRVLRLEGQGTALIAEPPGR